MNPDTPTDDDASRIFRENDDLGPDSSLWLRLIRQLLTEGKPLGRAVVVVFDHPTHGKLPFGAFALTRANRLIFWPVLPRVDKMVSSNQRIEVPHHVTLELPSGRAHVTAYNKAGKAVHRSSSWRLHHPPDNGFSLWFILVVRTDALTNEQEPVQRKARVPRADKVRREKEFIKFAQGLRFQSVRLPPEAESSSCVCCAVYLVDEGITTADTATPSFPPGSCWDAQIDGWTDGDQFLIFRSEAHVGSKRIIIALACPPGSPKSDIAIGFPRR